MGFFCSPGAVTNCRYLGAVLRVHVITNFLGVISTTFAHKYIISYLPTGRLPHFTSLHLTTRWQICCLQYSRSTPYIPNSGKLPFFQTVWNKDTLWWKLSRTKLSFLDKLLWTCWRILDCQSRKVSSLPLTIQRKLTLCRPACLFCYAHFSSPSLSLYVCVCICAPVCVCVGSFNNSAVGMGAGGAAGLTVRSWL